MTAAAQKDQGDDDLGRLAAEHPDEPVPLKVFDLVLTTLMGEIVALKREVRELQARPAGLKYLGVWQKDHAYNIGDFVTAHGSVWAAKKNVLYTEPGVDFDGWVLAVKKGRDGKGAR